MVMHNIWIYGICSLIGFLLVPFFDGIIRKTKAILSGRKGPSLLQTYYDLVKLFQKESLLSQFTSSFSKIAPVIIFLISIIFFFLVPITFQGISINIFVLIFIFAIGSFFLALYGLDNATYFGWLGASREVFVILLVEPLLLLSLAILWYSTWVRDLGNLHTIIANKYFVSAFLIQIILFGVILRYIMLAENKRYPFDNPTTHLELTMIHEAMLLETGGPTLWIIELAAKTNLIAFMSLLAFLVLPFDFGVTNVVVLFIFRFLKVACISILLWLWETYVTKLRVFRYPAVLLSLLALQILFVIFYKIIQ